MRGPGRHSPRNWRGRDSPLDRLAHGPGTCPLLSSRQRPLVPIRPRDGHILARAWRWDHQRQANFVADPATLTAIDAAHRPKYAADEKLADTLAPGVIATTLALSPLALVSPGSTRCPNFQHRIDPERSRLRRKDRQIHRFIDV